MASHITLNQAATFAGQGKPGDATERVESSSASSGWGEMNIAEAVLTRTLPSGKFWNTSIHARP